jgi:hypothetical protein
MEVVNWHREVVGWVEERRVGIPLVEAIADGGFLSERRILASQR